MKLNKNWPLIVGVAVPVIAVVAIAVSIYVPRLYVHPQYNFVYAENLGYAPVPCSINDTLPTTQISRLLPCGGYSVYLYNVSTNTNTQITASDENSYSLDTSQASPDGFTVGPSYSSGGPLFDDIPYDPNQVYLTKGTYSRKLNTLDTNSDDGDTFEFLGWVK
jgi:hypothetical protein